MADSDGEALGWLKRGDSRGFDRLYAKYQDRIYAFVFRLTGRRDAADDLFQETFLALARQGSALRPDSNLGAWLYTVARHAFLDGERRRRAGTSWGQADGDGASADALAGPAAADVTLSEIERALLALSVEDRQLLLLVGVEGVGQDEVAKMLDVEPAALRQRVVRARARLAAVLDPGGASKPAREQRS